MTADDQGPFYSAPDWQAAELQAAIDEQRRRPRWYPLTKRERLALEYVPDLTADNYDENQQD